MGNQLANLLLRRPENNFQPNIPYNQNDLNRPYSSQMLDMVIHYGVPMFCLAALASGNYELKLGLKKKDGDDDAAKQVQVLEQKLQELQQKQKDHQHITHYHAALQDHLKEIEDQEQYYLQENLDRLQFYEKGLETILDIRCSPFKSRHDRRVLEDILITKLSDEKRTVNGVIRYTQLKEIYDHDYKFCSYSKETNGKLRQLYIKQWKMQMEMEKYRRMIHHLKNANTTHKG